jgi:hypothetical protein
MGLLDRAARGPTKLVIQGVAGQGKTHLLRWTARSARHRGYLVLEVTGAEFERKLGFRALIAALQPIRPRIDDLGPTEQRALHSGLGARGDQVDMLEAYEALLRLLSLVAADQPVLVVADDAQWLDPTSLAALAFVARRSVDDRLGFLFAQRSGVPCLLDTIEFDRAELAGLPVGAVVELLAPRGVTRSVAERSSGVSPPLSSTPAS